MAKVYSEAYGCSANVADSEIMLGLLKQAGYEIVDSPEKANLNLLVTCAVKTPTVSRMIHKVKQLSKSNKPLIISGCLPKVNQERQVIERINPKASFLGPDAITKVVDVANSTLKGEKLVVLQRLKEGKAHLPHVRTNPVVDIVEINSGCLSNCIFCATKLARGDLFSYRPYLIREQIKQAIIEGCKEVWLTSQDSSAYGRDINTNLAELLESACKIDGKFFIRVGMMNPLHFKKIDLHQLIEAYKHEKVFKFLHLCLQSGSDKVLRIMRRGYTAKDFLFYVEEFRKEIPEITLLTDIIVGHPGEDEKDFKATLNVVKKVKPDLVNISKFGARPGTLAANMEQINPKIIDERSRILHHLVRRIGLRNNEKWLGWEGEIIIDEEVDNAIEGRNFAYKPIVIKEKINLGNFVGVKIIDAKPNYLVGILQ